jgi:HD-like signal output (HDOD) protein
MTALPAALHPVRQRLLKKAGEDAKMFALGTTVARVAQMAADDDHGVNDLAQIIVSDLALSTRVLRLANTVGYRSASSPPVTTISRAISVLGFDTVRTAALGMLLVDALDANRAGSVRAELEVSLCASLVGRAMVARQAAQQEGGGRANLTHLEEASVVALLKNIAPLLLATHENDTYRQIAAIIAKGQTHQEQAALAVLGCGYEALSQGVAQAWKLSAQLVQVLTPQPTGVLKKAASRQELTSQLACFGIDVARIAVRGEREEDSPMEQALLARYGDALAVDAEMLGPLLTGVKAEMVELLKCMRLRPAAADGGSSLPAALLEATLGGTAVEQAYHPSGKPTNARERLLAGVQDVTQMRASGRSKTNELMMAMLESIYSGLGFRYATVCLKDPKTGQYRARASFGDDPERQQSGFCFPATPGRDVFFLSMENNVDLIIADAREPKIAELLPAWHRALMPEIRSFVVLPVIIGKVQLGFFYGDRAQLAPEGMAPDEAALLKALKGQVLAALGG